MSLGKGFGVGFRWVGGVWEKWWESEQGLKGKEEKRVGGKGPESTLEKV